MRRVTRSTEVSRPRGFGDIFPSIVNTITGIILAILLIRILLRLFGANAQNVFVDFVYSISAFFVRPFINIFENIEIRDGMILEINTMIAMVVYALIAWIIISTFHSVTKEEVTEEFIDMK